MPDLPDHALVNRDSWTTANADYTDARARSAWSQEAITWGIWGVPEAELSGMSSGHG